MYLHIHYLDIDPVLTRGSLVSQWTVTDKLLLSTEHLALCLVPARVTLTQAVNLKHVKCQAPVQVLILPSPDNVGQCSSLDTDNGIQVLTPPLCPAHTRPRCHKPEGTHVSIHGQLIIIQGFPKKRFLLPNQSY